MSLINPKFNDGSRVIVTSTQFGNRGQSGTVRYMLKTLPAAKSGQLRDRLHMPQVGPFYAINFDNKFEGDEAFYTENDLAQI